MLGVGDIVPDFSLPDANGETFQIADQRGQRVVVLYFYPKDDTPGCTVEACGFRDHYEEFVDHGAVVVGVSADSVRSHGEFIAKHRLPFVLLSDEDGAVRRRFGVPKTLGLLPGRTTYVIDKQGVIRHVFNSQVRVRKHVGAALDVVKSLA
jgi:peroxiredoxin Q/BCP